MKAGRAGLAFAAAAMLVASTGAGALDSVTLSVPGRVNSNPSIAADGETVGVVWAAAVPNGGADAYCAVSRNGGRSFGTAVKVNDGDGDVQTNGEQPPRVTIAGSVIAVSWVSALDGKTIRVARSLDGGRRFEASQAVSARGAPGNRGWQSMTIDKNGDTVVAWLDHRDMASAGTHDHADPSSHGTRDGAEMAQRSALYTARVTRTGVEPERRITTGVCYCCKTAVASTSAGEVVAWRQVYAGNIRDIAFVGIPRRSAEASRYIATPIRVSEDNWQLDGCPDDGPAVAIDAQSRVHLVWPTLLRDGQQPAMALFYAMSTDGRRFTPRERMPTQGTPHHPQIAIAADGSPVFAWDELENGVRRAAYGRRVARPGGGDGAGTFIRDRGLAEEGAYPVLAATGDAVVTACAAGARDRSEIIVMRRPSSAAVPTRTRPGI